MLDMLRAKIKGCDAIIHIVGRCYGSEPPLDSLPPGKPRRSYTQLEADIARELKKPLYLFVCPADFPYDSEPSSEPDAKQSLQMAYREQVLVDLSRMQYQVKTLEELERQIATLGIRFEQFQRENNRLRKFTLTSFLGILIALVLIGGGLWSAIQGLSQSADMTEQTVESVAANVSHVANAADKLANTEDQVGEIASVLKGKPLQDLRTTWAAHSRLIIGLPKRLAEPVTLSLDRSSEIGKLWSTEISNTEQAVSQLRETIEAASRSTPIPVVASVTDALREKLELLAAQGRALSILGRDWEESKGKPFSDNPSGFAQLEVFEWRRDYMVRKITKQLREYAEMAYELEEEIGILLAGEVAQERAAAREIRLKVLDYEERIGLVMESSLVPSDLAEELKKRVEAAKALASKGDGMAAISEYEEILGDLRQRSFERAKMQALIVAHLFLDLVWASETMRTADLSFAPLPSGKSWGLSRTSRPWESTLTPPGFLEERMRCLILRNRSWSKS